MDLVLSLLKDILKNFGVSKVHQAKQQQDGTGILRTEGFA